MDHVSELNLIGLIGLDYYIVRCSWRIQNTVKERGVKNTIL